MRSVALDILMEVTEKGAYANIALRKNLGQAVLDPRDRALVTELVNETLRNLRRIDEVINHFSKTPTARMKPYIHNILRLTVCQLRFMSRIPPHAAVHEAVELAKRGGFQALAGFVNGVARAMVRRADEPLLNEKDWARWYSIPNNLAKDLVQWLGEDGAKEFAQNSHTAPAVTVHANTCKISAKELAERLKEEGVECNHVQNFLVLRHTGDISALKAFREGLFFVMDAGGMVAVEALRLRSGHTLLDMCAAPGGKSFAAACVMNDTGKITALDIRPHRVELMEAARRRLGFDCITTKVSDAIQYSTGNYLLPVEYDAVLLDAPCSGLGTLRKRPEIKHNYKGIPSKLLDTQCALLSAAAKFVKPAGTLVYSTCTVTREENAGMAEWFAAAHPQFVLEKAEQLLPGENNDGFFTAQFIRKI